MSFFGSLTGSDQAKAIKKAGAQAQQNIQTGYDQAQPFYQQAYDLFQPFAQQGQQATKTYGDALGLGSQQDQGAAEARYFQDPAMQSILGQKSNALLRQINAGGFGTNGAQLALAGARVGNEAYGGWLDRLNSLSGQGMQATGQQAAIRSGQGDLRYSLGAQQAGLGINTANGIAQAKSQGVNNLLNLAGTAVKAATLF